MSVGTFFDSAAGPSATPPIIRKTPKARPAPFSLRLSVEERARLEREAAGAPLGGYIRAKVLGDAPLRNRASGLAIEDRKALAQVLALLGHTRLASNLNQIAHVANIGALPVTPETEEELRAALAAVREIRDLLITALGMKPEPKR